jgi:Fe-S cluster assembly protein SufD
MSAVAERRNLQTSSAALGQSLGDPEWLAGLRAEAAALAESLPLPDSRIERPWKYYDVAKLGIDQFSAPSADTTRVSGDHAARFADLPENLQGSVRNHLGKTVPAGRSALTALHYAYLNGGVLVDVPANTEVSVPVRITRDYQGDGQIETPHTIIIAGANSRVTVVEDCTSSDGDLIVLPVVEIEPGPGAEVRYTVLHRWGENTRVFSEQRTVTERDSAVVGLSVSLGGAVVKSHIESSLVGRGSSSELLGLCWGYADQHSDFYTLQDHIGPDTRSDLLFKAALTDEARSVYYGLTRVGLGARNADANQENRNLLLSQYAKADSDPVLEILTNDIIRASHGATAGPVDREQLYYFAARGIDPSTAQRMLVRAFLGEVLGRITDLSLRDEVAGLVGLNESEDD